MEPKEKGNCTKASHLGGPGRPQELGPGMAMAAVSAGTENRPINGSWLWSLPPEKPEESCVKSKLPWNCSHSPLAYDVISQQMAKPRGPPGDI